jgi:zinc transport system ATP-binding protein
MSLTHHHGKKKTLCLVDVPPSCPAIEVKGLNYSINGMPVLKNITFSVNSGEYFGIIGPNGGGKTTLIKIMLGLIKPDSGSISYFGHNVDCYRGKHLIGYVPQKASQGERFFPATVEEVVRSGRTARIGLFRRFSAADDEAVKKAMAIADITKLALKPIARISGGELQRVMIARALACEPKILFMDEPTVAIDIASQEKFYDFVDTLNQKMRLTVIIISHDIAAVAKKVNTILCLNQEMVCHGKPAQLLKEEYMEKLYGKKVNLIVHGGI